MSMSIRDENKGKQAECLYYVSIHVTVYCVLYILVFVVSTSYTLMTLFQCVS